MLTSKRNEWLDAADSEEDDRSGYDSEAAEERKTARSAKRRRISTPEDEEDGDLASQDDEDLAAQSKTTTKRNDAKEEAVEEGEKGKSQPKFEPRRIRTPEPELRQLSAPTKSKVLKTGVIYLSRVPPFMKPQTVKHLLDPYGDIGRIFLTPEDPTSHTKRVKSGGNKKRSFTDGWVEFQRKKDAKIVAETLNAQIIGGKKGGWYHDDVWNIKYLRGFKWHHLTEQIANENAERAARLRAEISQTSKENKRFVANVERAKMLEGMQAKKKKQLIVAGDEEPSSSKRGHEYASKADDEQRQSKNTFRQNEVRTKSDRGKGGEDVHRVLSKIF